MGRIFSVAIFLCSFSFVHSQSNKFKENKYPSLLWEITGKGLKKTSHLFGTMHVSSKMAFNLSDSFYLAIKKADVVALETNPETWQEDMLHFNLMNDGYTTVGNGVEYRNAPSDYLNINTLKFYKYEKLIEVALSSNPSTINNLLYRTYSEKKTEFEEDTYLDLYIYQVGKKWNKKVVGVERYAESMKLAMEAYVDAMKDKNRKERSFEADDEFSFAKLQDAYRTGNLDLLDTINRLNSMSPAFDEKFLFRRNEIQAASIDSILKTNSSLFVGVGAAHLPGQRGVIEMLRRMGYKLRPIKMGERSSRIKDDLEKIKVPVIFSKQVSEDGFYKVDVPGKLYMSNRSINGYGQVQYADMANGAYYTVTRVQINAAAWGHNANDVLRKVDSVLYENIPGKILNKQPVTKNGYRGFSIINKTRRGDYQYYNVFITPFEIIFFKMSGTGEYLKEHAISQKFFSSIELKQYPTQWKKFSPAFGGFQIEMPHEPYVIKNDNWQFIARDIATNIDFQIIRSDIHNYEFVEEDSFDLSLMEESFTSSEFYDSTIERRQTMHKSYAALDAKYRYKDGSTALVRYLIRGPHYYTLIAQGKKELPSMRRFLNSFEIVPWVYKKSQTHTDTQFHFTVTTPYLPENKNGVASPAAMENIYTGLQEEDEPSERFVFKDRLIANDSTGEKIYISFFKSPKYYYKNDSSNLKSLDRFLKSEHWNTTPPIETLLPSGMKVSEYYLSDSASSRTIWTKVFYRDGINFTIRTTIDTVTKPSNFLTQFFESFKPADTIAGINPAVKKSAAFFADIFHSDTSTRKRAIHSIDIMSFDSTDVLLLTKAISSLNWNEKNYLTHKKNFIYKLGGIRSNGATDLLKSIYFTAGDTLEMQHAALESLVRQKTRYAYQTFRDILVNDPPVLNVGSSYNDDRIESGLFMGRLHDSLELTVTIFKDILPLINIDDYKYPIMRLLGALVDSNLILYKDYEIYSARFLIEARQAWKKQLIGEKKKSILLAEKKAKADEWDERKARRDSGNEILDLYATTLIPFWDKNPAVQQLLRQVLASSDKKLKFNTAFLFLRHNKPVPDSIFSFLASTDEYRYPLYERLNEVKKERLFPSKNKGHLALAKGKLISISLYDTPDTIQFLKALPLEWQKEQGAIYFFKYKRKKDDNNWKIASVGMISDDADKFEIEASNKNVKFDFDFTEFSDVKLKDDEPLADQLSQRRKQLLFSKRVGGKMFYDGYSNYDSADFIFDPDGQVISP